MKVKLEYDLEKEDDMKEYQLLTSAEFLRDALEKVKALLQVYNHEGNEPEKVIKLIQEVLKKV